MIRKTISHQSAPASDEADCLSVVEFCVRNRISVQAFYKHRTKMPDTFRIGTRVLIGKEAAARWRAERAQADKGKPLVTDVFHRRQRKARAKQASQPAPA